jgi:DNA-directed RNA polymerase omega subunit
MENNKYLLATMVAKRAKELEKGAKPLIKTKYRKPMMIALEEIKAGKVFIKEKKESLKSEDVFKEEDSVKIEEPVKPEDLSDKVKKPAKIEEISDEVKKPAKIKEISNEVKEPGKSKG